MKDDSGRKVRVPKRLVLNNLNDAYHYLKVNTLSGIFEISRTASWPKQNACSMRLHTPSMFALFPRNRSTKKFIGNVELITFYQRTAGDLWTLETFHAIKCIEMA